MSGDVALPKSWVVAQLNDLSEVHYGKALPEKSRIARGDVPVVGSSGVVGRHNAALIGDNCVVVGRKGAAGAVHLIAGPCWPIDTAYFLQPPEGLDIRWLSHVLGTKELGQLDKSTAIPSLSRDDLHRVLVPVAPRAEQTRIVEKLEELLSDLDAGVAELEAAQRKIGQYRQSLLKAAVEGMLTAEWRKQNKPRETGAQLFERILTERRARWEAKQLAKFKEQGKTPPKDWQKKYPEPVSPDTTNLPSLPKGWVWASLGQLLEGLTSGSRDWAPYYDRGSCTFVMAQNVRPWRPDFAFRQYVDPPLDDRDRARSAVKKDDLLVTIVGANTGQACRVHEALSSHFVCQSVALIRLVQPGLSEFVNVVLNSEGHGQRQFREMNYGAGRPHLSFDQIESVCIPLPPDAEQKEIIKRLELVWHATQDVESQTRFLFKQSTAQRKNLLKAAFSGQLVPQDPSDEPASVLLARIRAERAENVNKPRRRVNARSNA